MYIIRKYFIIPSAISLFGYKTAKEDHNYVTKDESDPLNKLKIGVLLTEILWLVPFFVITCLYHTLSYYLKYIIYSFCWNL